MEDGRMGRTSTTRSRWRGALAILLVASPAAGVAQAPRPPQPLVIEAENLTAAAARQAGTPDRGPDPEALRPGDLLRYRLRFTNLAADSVRQVQFTDPIPVGLRYIPGSASASRDDVRISYSIDGGRSYSTQPVIEEVVDGKTVRRPAPASRYTHIRWTVIGWLQPQATVTAAFQAQLPSSSDSASANNQENPR